MGIADSVSWCCHKDENIVNARGEAVSIAELNHEMKLLNYY